MMDNPGQLGADQVADAVAGIAGYPVPLILIDMGKLQPRRLLSTARSSM